MSDAYALGDENYPENRQAAFHFLEKFRKDVVRKPTVTHEGSYFAQIGNQQKQKSSDKAYTKDWYGKEKCKNITTAVRRGIHHPIVPRETRSQLTNVLNPRRKTTTTTEDSENQAGTLPSCTR